MSFNKLFNGVNKIKPFKVSEGFFDTSKGVSGDSEGLKPDVNESPESISADGDDIVLLVMNEKPIYDQYMMAVKNLKRKKDKGNYDRDLAVKLMMYPAKAGAQYWYKATREYYDDGTQVLQPSSQAIEQAAGLLRDDFENEYDVNKWEYA